MNKEVVGLALGGGGLRGSYEAGAFMAFKDYGIKFNMVSGTSIGSFNAAMIASHREKDMIDFWMTMKTTDFFELDPTLAEPGISLKKLKAFYDTFQEKKHGFNINPLREGAKKLVDEDALRRSRIKFGICTVKGTNPEPVEIFIDDMKKGKVVDYILASCFLPIFKKEELIDDNYYLDGGLYDAVPVNMLVREGCTKVYAIELKGFGHKRKVFTPGVEIIRIKSRHPLGSQLTVDNNKTKELIKLGYFDTMQVLKKLDGTYFYFNGKSRSFYERVLGNFKHKEVNDILVHYLAKNEKEVVIKVLEKIMKKEKMERYKIYYPRVIIKQLQIKTSDKTGYDYELLKKFNIL